MSLTGRRIAGVVGLAASGLPGQPRAPAPERPAPGVYALARVGGRSVPAVLVAPYERPPAEVRERVLAGWLVLRPGGRFVTSLCIDQVDSAGRVVGERDGDMHSRFWQSGGRVYYQVVVVDGPQDSAVARVRGDTLAFDDAVWVRVRGARLPRNEGWGWMDACPAARAQPRAAAAAPPDGYEDCTDGGAIALSVELSDAATGRGIPWRVAPFAHVEWRAGRSAGTGRHMPNFGPGGGYPAEGTADRLQIGVVWGRPGTYRLRVRAPGYRVWDTAGVRVPEGVNPRFPLPPYAAPHCGTGTEVVVPARLQPDAARRP